VVPVQTSRRSARTSGGVGHLTGGVAHDFNNVLAVILGNLELMEEQIREPHLAEMIGDALSAVTRGAHLARQLLAFGRRSLLSPVALDLNEQIRAMSGMLRLTVPAHVEIETRCAEGLWPVELDPSQIEAAILNIVINARDAMPGGGRLTIATGNADLTADALGGAGIRGRHVVISIRDTGCGMDAETLAKVFDPFFTTKPVGEGTGLGMSMVHGFVHQSGGRITVESAPGEGTLVALYFPAGTMPALAIASAPAPPVPRAARGESILVVDDEEQVRRPIVAQLRSLGYRVTEAEDGESALAVLESGEDIELLLTDMIMPGSLRGAELARQAHTLCPDIKTVFMTGLPSEAQSIDAQSGPGAMVLSKPISKAILARAVWKIFND
jgi:CheY-like chemotaxis protein